MKLVYFSKAWWSLIGSIMVAVSPVCRRGRCQEGILVLVTPVNPSNGKLIGNGKYIRSCRVHQIKQMLAADEHEKIRLH